MPRLKKHLLYYAWPKEDRALWDAAFDQDLFDDDGRTDHLASATIIGLRTSYARYLGFLRRHDLERLKRAPEDRIDTDSIKAFVEHLRQSCRDTSVASLLHTLRQGLGYMFPHRDWSWPKTVAKHIQAGAIPLRDATRGVTSAELYAVGVALMAPVEEELVASGHVTLEGAIQYRDGLIIALLAMVPLRRRTLTALTINRHLVKIGEYWRSTSRPRTPKRSGPWSFLCLRICPDASAFISHASASWSPVQTVTTDCGHRHVADLWMMGRSTTRSVVEPRMRSGFPSICTGFDLPPATSGRLQIQPMCEESKISSAKQALVQPRNTISGGSRA